IVWDGSDLHGLNASGRSPAGWTAERFAGRDTMPERGWDSVTVPGAVGGWVALSERFGKLPFAALFEPAIALAEKGFALSPVIATLWARGAEVLKDQPGFADHFMPEGRVPIAGERVRNPDLASSLRAISETKGEAFYRGAMEDAARHGAALTLGDMAANAPDWCGTISAAFDDVELHEIPPNGQGIAACMALGMLSHTGVRDLGPDDPKAIHLMIEAMKLA
ncbi:MAG: gamma-glutamyltransferase, partial [Candidatus Binatia bacterium]